MNIKIMPIDEIRPSTYNPRRQIPERLEMVKLSLSKLGFLSPIIADLSGEILSGHQRHHVALMLGFKEVPVLYCDFKDEDQRKAINIVFNRGTNDMEVGATTKTMAEQIQKLNIHKMASDLPDAIDQVRCAKPVQVSVDKLVKVNSGRWIDYAANIAKTLAKRGVVLPIICTPDNVVVNGIGRLQVAAEKKQKTVNVVYINPSEASFAQAMLNLLSMDFDIDERYADQLRYNSFRRANTTRAGLGKGFYAEHFGNVTTKEFNLDDPSKLKKWKALYGQAVVDFGAGKFTDTEILKSYGVDVTPFEPYPISGNNVDIDLSQRVVKAFLNDVANGKKFDCVFISSVLNSVPFRKDREMIAIIVAALLGKRGKCYAWTMAINHNNIKTLTAENRNERNSSSIQFRLDYEPGILLGDLGAKPKAQKFHTGQELYETFKVAFSNVKVKLVAVDLSLVASGPCITNEQLREALEFEFNLPYPDGTRMGLVNEAIAAFEKRLGVKL